MTAGFGEIDCRFRVCFCQWLQAITESTDYAKWMNDDRWRGGKTLLPAKRVHYARILAERLRTVPERLLA